MAGLAEARVQRVMQAFVSRNPEQLAEVIAGDARIDALQIEIDDRCFRLIALHHPVAVDLRTIVSVLKINTDLERVGDLAVNIGEAGERYLPPASETVDRPAPDGGTGAHDAARIDRRTHQYRGIAPV